jgi:hypothetical protein
MKKCTTENIFTNRVFMLETRKNTERLKILEKMSNMYVMDLETVLSINIRKLFLAHLTTKWSR